MSGIVSPLGTGRDVSNSLHFTFRFSDFLKSKKTKRKNKKRREKKDKHQRDGNKSNRHREERVRLQIRHTPHMYLNLAFTSNAIKKAIRKSRIIT